jgi:hypothetical protein
MFHLFLRDLTLIILGAGRLGQTRHLPADFGRIISNFKNRNEKYLKIVLMSGTQQRDQ